jgi:hypothetical protein
MLVVRLHSFVLSGLLYSFRRRHVSVGRGELKFIMSISISEGLMGNVGIGRAESIIDYSGSYP